MAPNHSLNQSWIFSNKRVATDSDEGIIISKSEDANKQNHKNNAILKPRSDLPGTNVLLLLQFIN